MSSGSKVLLGICTFLPLVFGIMFIAYYLSVLAEMMRFLPTNEDDPNAVVQFYFSRILNMKIILLAVLSVITWLALVIYYILHAVKHIKGDGEKIMWILLFIFIGSLCFPVYFFMRVVPMPSRNEIAGTA